MVSGSSVVAGRSTGWSGGPVGRRPAGSMRASGCAGREGAAVACGLAVCAAVARPASAGRGGASVGDELAADPSAGWEGPSDREAGAAVASAGPSPGAAGSGVVPGPGMRTAAGASGLTCFWASPDGRSACCPSPPVFAGSRSPSPATRGGTGPWPGPPPSTGGSGLGLLRASCPSLSSESDPLSTEPGPLSTCGADAVAVLVAGLPSTCGADAGSLTPGPASTSTSGRALLSEPERPCSPDWPSPLGASSATSDAGGSGGSGGSGRSGRRRPGRGVGSVVRSTHAPSCSPPDGRWAQPIGAGALPRRPSTT